MDNGSGIGEIRNILSNIKIKSAIDKINISAIIVINMLYQATHKTIDSVKSIITVVVGLILIMVDLWVAKKV